MTQNGTSSKILRTLRKVKPDMIRINVINDKSAKANIRGNHAALKQL